MLHLFARNAVVSLLLPLLISSCSTAPPNSTRIVLKDGQASAEVALCIPNQWLSPSTATLSGGNANGLALLHFVRTGNSAFTRLDLEPVSVGDVPRNDQGVPSPNEIATLDFRIDVANRDATFEDYAPGRAPIRRRLAVDLPGDNDDLFWATREDDDARADIVLYVPRSDAQASRVRIFCHRSVRDDSGQVDQCSMETAMEGGLFARVSTGSDWLSFWPQVTAVGVEKIRQFRAACAS